MSNYSEFHRNLQDLWGESSSGTKGNKESLYLQFPLLYNRKPSRTEFDSNEPGTMECFNGKNGVEWSSVPIPDSSMDTPVIPPDLKVPLNTNVDPMSCWELLFTQDILEDIVKYTNRSLKQRSMKFKNSCPPTSVTELKAVFGLLLLSGVFNYNRRKAEDLWSTDGTGMEIFRMAIGANRFSFLLANLEFDDVSTRGEREQLDKFAPMRDIVERFNANCQKVFKPSDLMTIYEKLEPYKGVECTFRQYVPDRTQRYGIRVISLVCSKTCYVYHMQVHIKGQPAGPYKFCDSPTDMILKMVEPISGSNRLITMDQRFTNFELFERLFTEHNLRAIGAIKKTSDVVPTKFVSLSGRDLHSNRFVFRQNMVLISHITAQNFNFLLLSTSGHGDRLSEAIEEIKSKPIVVRKPEAVVLYSMAKSGVDTVNRMWEKQSCSRKVVRWVGTMLYNLLNLSGANSQIIYRFATGDTSLNRPKFLKKLAMQLMRDQLEERKKTAMGDMKENLFKVCEEMDKEDHDTIDYGNEARCRNATFPQISDVKHEELADEEEEDSKDDEPAVKKKSTHCRCKECPKSSSRKCRTVCQTCQRVICRYHMYSFCTSCTQVMTSIGD